MHPHARGTAAGQRVELQVIHLEPHNLDQVEDTDGVVHNAHGKMPSTVDDLQEVVDCRFGGTQRPCRGDVVSERRDPSRVLAVFAEFDPKGQHSYVINEQMAVIRRVPMWRAEQVASALLKIAQGCAASASNGASASAIDSEKRGEQALYER